MRRSIPLPPFELKDAYPRYGIVPPAMRPHVQSPYVRPFPHMKPTPPAPPRPAPRPFRPRGYTTNDQRNGMFPI